MVLSAASLRVRALNCPGESDPSSSPRERTQPLGLSARVVRSRHRGSRAHSTPKHRRLLLGHRSRPAAVEFATSLSRLRVFARLNCSGRRVEPQLRAARRAPKVPSWFARVLVRAFLSLSRRVDPIGSSLFGGSRTGDRSAARTRELGEPRDGIPLHPYGTHDERDDGNGNDDTAADPCPHREHTAIVARRPLRSRGAWNSP